MAAAEVNRVMAREGGTGLIKAGLSILARQPALLGWSLAALAGAMLLAGCLCVLGHWLLWGQWRPWLAELLLNSDWPWVPLWAETVLQLMLFWGVLVGTYLLMLLSAVKLSFILLSYWVEEMVLRTMLFTRPDLVERPFRLGTSLQRAWILFRIELPGLLLSLAVLPLLFIPVLGPVLALLLSCRRYGVELAMITQSLAAELEPARLAQVAPPSFGTALRTGVPLGVLSMIPLLGLITPVFKTLALLGLGHLLQKELLLSCPGAGGAAAIAAKEARVGG